MNTVQSSSQPGPAPNADLIAGLRQVADWLEAHPELTAARWASVFLRDSAYGREPDATARPDLERLAAALGDRATERVQGTDVRIEGEFAGGVRVSGQARMCDLLPEPQSVPAYDPILPKPSLTVAS